MSYHDSSNPFPDRDFSSPYRGPVAPLDLTDEALLELVQQNDEVGLGLLHDRYAPTLKALAMRVLNHDAESDGIVHETFLEIWDRADSFGPSDGSALGWIVELTRRRAIDRLYQRGAGGHREEEWLEPARSRLPAQSDPVKEELFHVSMRRHLTCVLQTFPMGQRLAIELLFFRGMTPPKIASATGVSLGTIKTRIEYAIKRLTVALKGLENLL